MPFEVLANLVTIDVERVVDWITGGAAVSLPGLIQYLRKQANKIAENIDKIGDLEKRIVELEKHVQKSPGADYRP